MSNDNDNSMTQNPGIDPNGDEELGAWGVPEKLEDSTAANAGFPAGVGMPGIYSGDVTEPQDDQSEPQASPANPA